MKKVQSVFSFTENYITFKGDIAIAIIYLHIDYVHRVYSISSCAVNPNKPFVFYRNSNESNLWFAITNLIQTAIEFGNNEIESAGGKNEVPF